MTEIDLTDVFGSWHKGAFGLFPNKQFIAGKKDYEDLDGMNIKSPEIVLVGGDLANRLLGRDFSEITVSAKPGDLVWITVKFPAVEGDIEILRDMVENVKRGAKPLDNYKDRFG